MERPGPEGIGEWRTTPDGLKFKVDKKGLFVLIACDKRYCATDRFARNLCLRRYNENQVPTSSLGLGEHLDLSFGSKTNG
jgi:hypothetical protein